MKYLIYILPFSINIIELITIFIGLYHYRKYKHTPLKYFLYLLWYGIFTEAMGIVVSIVFKYPNYIVFNIYVLVRALFLLWLFGKYFKNKVNIKITQFFKYFLILWFVIDSVFYENILATQSFIYYISSLFLIITIILFFIEILNSEAILKIKKLLIFWVAAGVLLFELGYTPVFIAHKYINYTQGLTYGYILLLLNFLTSICFCLGFIWSKKDVDY